MSPDLVHFKALPRGFDGGAINWTSGDIKKSFLKREGEEKRDWSARLEMIGFAASHLVFLTLLL